MTFRNIITWLVGPVLIGLLMTGHATVTAQQEKQEQPQEEQQQEQQEQEEQSEKEKNLLSEEQTAEYREIVTNLRGLSFKNDPVIRILNRENLKERMRENFEEEVTPEDLKKWEETLVAFGVFPEDRNLMDTYVNMMGQQVAGFYDPETKELYLVEEDEDVESPFGQMGQQFGISHQDIVSVHELVHALQDQHFNLQAMSRGRENNDDTSVAIDALVEGDASYVQYDYMFQQRGMSLAEAGGFLKSQIQNTVVSPQTSMMGGGSEEVPMFLEKTLAFPYTAGLLFAMELKQESEGWTEYNRAFRDPPVSTQQILHPEKYLGESDYPYRLTLPDVSDDIGDGWERLSRNNMGEYGTHLVLLEHFPDQVQENTEARTGWNGDSYSTYHNEEKDRTALAWFTTWNSENDAGLFFDRYTELLQEKYANPEILQDRENRFRFVSEDNRHSLLVQRGKDVLLLEQFPEGAVKSAVTRHFQQSERERLDEVEIDYPESSEQPVTGTGRANQGEKTPGFEGEHGWNLNQMDSFSYETENGLLFGYPEDGEGVKSVVLRNASEALETVLGNHEARIIDRSEEIHSLNSGFNKQGSSGHARLQARGISEEFGEYRLRIRFIQRDNELLVVQFIATPGTFEQYLTPLKNWETQIRENN